MEQFKKKKEEEAHEEKEERHEKIKSKLTGTNIFFSILQNSAGRSHC